MQIYIIKVYGDMSLKTLHNIPQEVESEVIDNLHIVTSERVLNSRDIWNGRRLKDMFRSVSY